MRAEFRVFIGRLDLSQSGKSRTIFARGQGQRPTLEAALKKAQSLKVKDRFVWIEADGVKAHLDSGTRIKNSL